MLNKLIRRSVLGMGLLVLVSCQTAEIPNVQFVGSLGSSGAVQFDLLDSKTSDLTLLEFATYWDDLSNPKGPPVCMRTSDWASLKMALEELCSWSSGTCTAQQQEALTNFTNQMNNVEEKDTN